VVWNTATGEETTHSLIPFVPTALRKKRVYDTLNESLHTVQVLWRVLRRAVCVCVCAGVLQLYSHSVTKACFSKVQIPATCASLCGLCVSLSHCLGICYPQLLNTGSYQPQPPIHVHTHTHTHTHTHRHTRSVPKPEATSLSTEAAPY